jgi:hypothetical protein
MVYIYLYWGTITMNTEVGTLLTELSESVEKVGESDVSTEKKVRNTLTDGDAAVDVQTVETSLSSGDDHEESNAIVSSLEDISLEEDLLKSGLDDLLLGMIAARDGACGKTLRSDLFAIGYDISPGTLYPHLHDLESDGVLTMHEGVKTKEFRLADPDEVRDHLRFRVRNLLALAIALETGRSEI